MRGNLIAVYSDGGQAATLIESAKTYARHAAGNGNGDKATTRFECIFTDAYYTIRDCDRGQTATARVFISGYCSVFYVLNDRKVKPQIQWAIKKSKI